MTAPLVLEGDLWIVERRSLADSFYSLVMRGDVVGDLVGLIDKHFRISASRGPFAASDWNRREGAERVGRVKLTVERIDE